MKKGVYITRIIIVALLLISSLSMYFLYPHIYEDSQKENYDNSLQNYLAHTTTAYNYIIDQKLHHPDQINYSEYVTTTGENAAFLNDSKQDFFNWISDYEKSFEKNEGIDFYAVDLDTNKILTNNNQLHNIENDKDIQKQYYLYFQIIFNKASDTYNIGFVNTGDTFLEYDQNVFLDYLPFTFDEDEDLDDPSTLSIHLPNNLSITYGIKKDVYIDKILVKSNDAYLSYRYLFPYFAIFSLISFIGILIIPYRYLKENQYLSYLSEIKFEILGPIWILINVILLDFTYKIAASTMSKDINNFYKAFAIEYMGPYITPLLNISLLILFFAMIMFFAYMVKYFFKKGIKAYWKENTCIMWLYYAFKREVNEFSKIDLHDSANKTILKVISLNALLLITIIAICTFITLILFHGIDILLLIFVIFFLYSWILFVIVRKKYVDIQNDYQILFNATEELSNGNFYNDINQDVGIFNSLRDEFSHIKNGFQKAVNDEVKSQKMKTELISNVSHDLKTPLTSIISYINLLKEDCLNDQQRETYLDILDRNALRLKNLIEDLFEVSKANSGDIQLHYMNVDIVSLIKQAQLECQDQFDEKQLDVRFSANQEKIICSLDSSKTYRIFENLFINISKYALENTRVYIDVINHQNSVDIIFKNISKDEMRFNENEIVERFVQGDESRNTSGSGLGLAIVKSFTEVQGGQFRIELDGDLFKSYLSFKK